MHSPAEMRAPTRTIRDWIMDSRQWERFTPRDGDIVIATAPKCGTTWTQRIVALLVFQSPEPRPIHAASPWIDCRFQMPLDAMMALVEGQTHRRFVKSHLPFDALPVYGGVRYIHVARDGRDACMSFFNHSKSYTDFALGRFDAIGMEDETIARPFPRPPQDAREFYLNWIAPDAPAAQSDFFFATEQSYWDERDRENLLLVHYNDLKADLDGEMRRISAFLDIAVNEDVWPALVEAARFETMKAQGADLLPGIGMAFEGGHDTFLHRGTNGRWRDVLSEADLALYEQRAAASLSPGLRRWLGAGRLKTGDPKESAD